MGSKSMRLSVCVYALIICASACASYHVIPKFIEPVTFMCMCACRCEWGSAEWCAVTVQTLCVLSALFKCFLPLFLPAFSESNLYKAAADTIRHKTHTVKRTHQHGCPQLRFCSYYHISSQQGDFRKQHSLLWQETQCGRVYTQPANMLFFIIFMSCWFQENTRFIYFISFYFCVGSRNVNLGFRTWIQSEISQQS